MSEPYSPDRLVSSIHQSRSLLPFAIDTLCDLITETTGKSPNRPLVEYTSLFWAMQTCDRVVASEPPRSSDAVVNPENVSFPPTRRSRILSSFSSKSRSIMIVDPYFKFRPVDELIAIQQSRHVLSWKSVPSVPDFVSSPDEKGRTRVFEGNTNDSDALTRLRRVFATTAPIELVEQHHALAAWSNSESDPRVRLLYTANAHQSSIPFRYLMFAQRQRGTKIAVHQHGGGYGIDEMHFGEEHDISMSDVFFTWGWHRPDLGSRTRPLPTAFPAKRDVGTRRQYLLMSLPVTSHFYRFQPFLIPHHVERMVNETVSFIRGLRASTDLCFRSAPSAPFPVAQFHGAAVSPIFDKGREQGAKLAARAGLVIHNYLGTSWLETLAMNVPTVCFYDPSIFRAREEARPFIDALARVGVIHLSGAEAARFVNDLNGDPSVWWNKPEVQEARESFVARYANFKEDWLPGWIEEFERLLAE